jgi:hypothetical protein
MRKDEHLVLSFSLHPNQQEIIELSILDGEGNTLINSLISPIAPIYEHEMREIGLTKRDFHHQPTWDQLFPLIKHVLMNKFVLTHHSLDEINNSPLKDILFHPHRVNINTPFLKERTLQTCLRVIDHVNQEHREIKEKTPQNKDEKPTLSPIVIGENQLIDHLDDLIWYLSFGSNNEKRLAASAINKLSSKFKDKCAQIVPFLLRALGEESPQVRQYSLNALSNFSLAYSERLFLENFLLNEEKEYNRKIAERILIYKIHE